MPRKKNSRAAQGAGNIRKKTVVKNGLPYTYWEARVTIGRDPGTGSNSGVASLARRKRKCAKKCRPPQSLSMTETILNRRS